MNRKLLAEIKHPSLRSTRANWTAPKLPEAVLEPVAKPAGCISKRSVNAPTDPSPDLSAEKRTGALPD